MGRPCPALLEILNNNTNLILATNSMKTEKYLICYIKDFFSIKKDSKYTTFNAI